MSEIGSLDERDLAVQEKKKKKTEVNDESVWQIASRHLCVIARNCAPWARLF
jgi:hypothetical protein